MIAVFYKDSIEEIHEDIVTAQYYPFTQISIVNQTEPYFNLDYEYTNYGRMRQAFLIDDFEGSVGDVLTPEELQELAALDKLRREFVVPEGGGGEPDPILEGRVTELEITVDTPVTGLKPVVDKLEVDIYEEPFGLKPEFEMLNEIVTNTTDGLLRAVKGEGYEGDIETGLLQRMDNVHSELEITTADILPDNPNDFDYETSGEHYPEGLTILRTLFYRGFPHVGETGLLVTYKVHFSGIHQEYYVDDVEKLSKYTRYFTGYAWTEFVEVVTENKVVENTIVDMISLVNPDEFNNLTPPSEYPIGNYISYTPESTGFPDLEDGILQSNKLQNVEFSQVWYSRGSGPLDGYYVRYSSDTEDGWNPFRQIVIS